MCVCVFHENSLSGTGNLFAVVNKLLFISLTSVTRCVKFGMTSLFIPRAGLHVRVTPGELALCDQRWRELSEYEIFAYTCEWTSADSETENMTAVDQFFEQVGMNWGSSVSFNHWLDMTRFREGKLTADVYVALAFLMCSIPCIKASFMKKPTNALAITCVVYWPHPHVSAVFGDHPQGVEY